MKLMKKLDIDDLVFIVFCVTLLAILAAMLWVMSHPR